MLFFCNTLKLILALSISGHTSSITQPGSYVSQNMPAQVVSIGEQSAFNTRRDVALKVEKILHKDGITDKKIITSVLVNMWQESKWNPGAKSGSCVGLFQLHTKFSGRGMSMAQLTTINDHMYRLISLGYYKKWKLWAIKNRNKATCGEMAYRFASEVERCAIKHRGIRRTIANRWYGALLRR